MGLRRGKKRVRRTGTTPRSISPGGAERPTRLWEGGPRSGGEGPRPRRAPPVPPSLSSLQAWLLLDTFGDDASIFLAFWGAGGREAEMDSKRFV